MHTLPSCRILPPTDYLPPTTTYICITLVYVDGKELQRQKPGGRIVWHCDGVEYPGFLVKRSMPATKFTLCLKKHFLSNGKEKWVEVPENSAERYVRVEGNQWLLVQLVGCPTTC